MIREYDEPVDMKVDLTESELEYLHKVHVATAIRQLTQMPGWEFYTQIIADMIARLENQHLNFAGQASRDAYWASGLRLGAAREFAKILQDTIAKEVDLLNQPLVPPNRNGRGDA
jgi:hypothetical protein